MNTAYPEGLHKHTLSVAQRSKQLEQSLFQAHGYEPTTVIMTSQHQGYEQTPKAPGNPAQPRCDFSSNPADGLEPYQGLLPNIFQVQNPKDRSYFHNAALFHRLFQISEELEEFRFGRDLLHWSIL